MITKIMIITGLLIGRLLTKFLILYHFVIPLIIVSVLMCVAERTIAWINDKTLVCYVKYEDDEENT